MEKEFDLADLLCEFGFDCTACPLEVAALDWGNDFPILFPAPPVAVINNGCKSFVSYDDGKTDKETNWLENQSAKLVENLKDRVAAYRSELAEAYVSLHLVERKWRWLRRLPLFSTKYREQLEQAKQLVDNLIEQELGLVGEYERAVNTARDAAFYHRNQRKESLALVMQANQAKRVAEQKYEPMQEAYIAHLDCADFNNLNKELAAENQRLNDNNQKLIAKVSELQAKMPE